MHLSDFDYPLPPELIAQTPLPRGESRLMVVERASGRIEHRRFCDLPQYLTPGDTLVLNDTRVSARRVFGKRAGGHPLEVLLLHPADETTWAALTKPARSLRPGTEIALNQSAEKTVAVTVVDVMADGTRLLRFPDAQTAAEFATAGEPPLPPYIHEKLQDEERYQTVYSQHTGSAAAPTAGLHFTPDILKQIEAMGVATARITLHVGVDTFRPVRTEDLSNHVMHGEWFSIAPDAAETINRSSGRVLAVGTTCVRALESAADKTGRVTPGSGITRLFITPGWQFRIVDALQTNFHLPKSTLLMLISALAGRELVMQAYLEAVEHRYRFFSFGDAMLIL
jgi:S-adenosylmethionine:tRNA ribosyltransferase-isomerase